MKFMIKCYFLTKTIFFTERFHPIFETAAFRVCLILFPGSYSGILKPNIHFIELEKDFSNISEVLDQMKDPERSGLWFSELTKT